MLTIKPVELLRVISLAVVFIAAGNAALAQTPTPRPTPNPRQSDAKRPPGSETQAPNTPPGTQPGPPTAAPATQQPAPQAPLALRPHPQISPRSLRQRRLRCPRLRLPVPIRNLLHFRSHASPSSQQCSSGRYHRFLTCIGWGS